MKKILREPLLHFLLLGAAIFVAYGLLSKRSSDEPGKIVISAGQVAVDGRGLRPHLATSADQRGDGRD